MIATVTPIRLRRWTPPAYGTAFRRKADGTVWILRGIYRIDQQVRLEREGARSVYPFANMLREDWEALA